MYLLLKTDRTVEPSDLDTRQDQQLKVQTPTPPPYVVSSTQPPSQAFEQGESGGLCIPADDADAGACVWFRSLGGAVSFVRPKLGFSETASLFEARV